MSRLMHGSDCRPRSRALIPFSFKKDAQEEDQDQFDHKLYHLCNLTHAEEELLSRGQDSLSFLVEDQSEPDSPPRCSF